MEWKEYKLKDVCSRLSAGKNIKAAEVFSDGPYPVYGGNGLRGYSRISNFDGSCAIIGRQGAYCGNVRYFSGEGYMTEHAVVCQANELADTYYLTCLLSTMHLENLSGQSAQPGLAVGTLAVQDIYLPSLDYQEKVASILSSLDCKIELNNKINAQLEEMAQAIFKNWFVDFEPFKDGEFEESELGMIPKGWRVGTLGDITINETSKVGKRNDVKVLSPVTTGELVLSEEYFTKQVFSASIAKYKIVKCGDFAYNPARVNIGSLGRNEFDFDGCVSPVYVVFSVIAGYENFVDLTRKTESFKSSVLSRAIGGVRQSLSFDDFSMIATIIPSQEAVEAFNKIYESFKIQIDNNKNESFRLSALRDTLLPKLMNGEIEI